MRNIDRGVKTGLDRMGRCWPRRLRGLRLGLVAHPASVDRGLGHAVRKFSESGAFRLAALFGPQHGFLGHTQDNMVEWQGYRDVRSGLPVFSLYGRTRKPTSRMLDGLDVLAIDLQDVGARYYTFIWTMDLAMEAADAAGLPVVVLDRPNPLGGVLTEGPVLKPEWASFVGRRPIPVRHGMTIGEISLYLRNEFMPGLDLTIIPMKGWKRSFLFSDTGLPWVMPSPNMPTPDTALVYPGMCLLEGTNLSEGRGTTRPFELFGAPFIDSGKLVSRLRDFRLPGVVFRPASFQPAFQKHAGKLCGGAQIHMLSKERFRPFRTAVAILKAVRELYPKEFRWNNPPYEYENEKLPIDILAGSDSLRRDIEAGRPLGEMASAWAREASSFADKFSSGFRLY